MSSRILGSEYGYSAFSRASRQNLLSQKQIPNNMSQRSISNYSRQSNIEIQKNNLKEEDVSMMVSKIEFNQEKIHELHKENKLLRKENHKLKKIRNGFSCSKLSAQNSMIDQSDLENKLEQKNVQIEQLQQIIQNLQIKNSSLQKTSNQQQNVSSVNEVKIAKKLLQKTDQVKQLKVQLQSLQKENKNLKTTYEQKIKNIQQTSEIKNQNAIEVINSKLQVLQNENEQLKRINEQQLQEKQQIQQSSMNLLDQKMKEMEYQLQQRPAMMFQSSEEFIRLLDLYKQKLKEKDDEIFSNKRNMQILKNQIHELNIRLNEQFVQNEYQNKRNNVMQNSKSFSLQELSSTQIQNQNIKKLQPQFEQIMNFSFNQFDEVANKENNKQKDIQDQIVKKVLQDLEVERLQQYQQSHFLNSYNF